MNGSVTFLKPQRAGAAGVHRRLATALCAVAAMLAAPAMAGDNRSVKASTTVIDPLTLTKTKDMDFGFVVPPDAGTVEMTFDPATGSDCVASAGLLRGGTCEAAEFVGYGSTGQRVRIRLPDGQEVTLLPLTGVGDPMLVSLLDIYIGDGLNKFNNAQGPNQQFRIDSDNGGFYFRVGGTLNVNASQASGLYEGTFTMQIDYQ